MKTGSPRFTSDYDQFVRKLAGGYQLNFYERLVPWFSEFGREAVSIGVLEKQQLDGKDLIADFSTRCGFVQAASELESRGYTRVGPINESPGPRTVAVLKLIRRLFSRASTDEIDLRLTQFMRRIINYGRLRGWDAGRFYGMTPGLRAELLNRFSESNSKVASEFLYRRDARLFYELAPLETATFALEALSDGEQLELAVVAFLWHCFETDAAVPGQSFSRTAR